MAMDVKEKLVEILDRFVYDDWYGNDDIAEKLIANGVTVQECKLEDKKTNADHIRSMNDEMLDGFICSLLRCEFCKFGRRDGCDLLEWLQQPAEEDDNEAD